MNWLLELMGWKNYHGEWDRKEIMFDIKCIAIAGVLIAGAIWMSKNGW